MAYYVLKILFFYSPINAISLDKYIKVFILIIKNNLNQIDEKMFKNIKSKKL